jgi:very-short-patch-repair endonuclease
MREGQKRDRARALRRDMTDAERVLWRCLRMRQLDGHRFRRQVPVGPYIADFACLAASLLVEVDGGQHAEASADVARDAFLRARGFRLLRFWNHELLADPDAACEAILQALADSPVSRERREAAPAAGRR